MCRRRGGGGWWFALQPDREPLQNSDGLRPCTLCFFMYIKIAPRVWRKRRLLVDLSQDQSTGYLFSEGFREISNAPHWTYMSNYIPVYKVYIYRFSASSVLPAQHNSALFHYTYKMLLLCLNAVLYCHVQ